jgi:pimeloyl-ACP methyl ester carboxylesterase
MERVVMVEDHPVRYLSAGTGPELVLLPGSERARPTGRRSFPGWQRRGRCTHRPCPASTGTVARAEVSAEGYARFVGRFLDALGVKRPVLVGHSLGGWWGCCSPRRLLVEWLRYA